MLQTFFELFSPYKDGAIYDPSTDRDVQIIVNLLQISSDDKAIDLGSGDGRVVIAIAKKGADTYGLERDSALVKQSRNSISKKGLDDRAAILETNFWNENLSLFNKIVIYQYYTVMNRLEKKLMVESPIGAYIVSHHWKFPNWEISRQVEDIYLYIKK